jgi:DNA-binding NtrC family response regulator
LRKTQHILVVDDEKDTCLLLSQVLEKEGYAVDMANSGRDALSILRRKKIDLVITDLKMPEMDGLAFMREARRLKSRAKFIMMTAYGEIETYLDAINLGAFDYLNKPMEISDVRNVVKKALQGSKS